MGTKLLELTRNGPQHCCPPLQFIDFPERRPNEVEEVQVGLVEGLSLGEPDATVVTFENREVGTTQFSKEKELRQEIRCSA